MKNFFLIFIALVSFLSLSSCNTPQSAIRDLESLLNKVEKNYDRYTPEDWNKIEASYSEIDEKLKTHEYNAEERKQIGLLKGKYMGYRTKRGIMELGKGLQEMGEEIEGGVKGFIDALSGDDKK